MMKNRYDSITWIRSVAILFVVLGHATAVFDTTWGGTSQINCFPLAMLCRVIKTFHMPLFMSISGFLYYAKQIEKTKTSTDFRCGFFDFLKKKVYRLLVPLILVKVFWVAPVRYFSGFYDSDNRKAQLLECIFNPDVGHLWFLYVLFSIFMIQSIISFFYKDSRNRLIIATALAGIIGYFAMISGIPNQIANILKYNYFFMLGEIIFLLYQDKVKVKKYMRYLMIVAIALFTVLLTRNIIQTRWIKILLEFFVASMDIVAIHTFFKEMLKRGVKMPRIFSVLADYSMGIYLFHEPILYFVLSQISTINPYGLCLVLFGSGLILSMLITMVLRKIGLNIVLGEKC